MCYTRRPPIISFDINGFEMILTFGGSVSEWESVKKSHTAFVCYSAVPPVHRSLPPPTPKPGTIGHIGEMHLV